MHDAPLKIVAEYHERTKHHLRRYARSLGYMDWVNQPDPFRRYDGAPALALDHPVVSPEPTYDALFASLGIEPQPVDRHSLSRLFYDSLALSAWKQSPGTPPWSLRVNRLSAEHHPWPVIDTVSAAARRLSGAEGTPAGWVDATVPSGRRIGPLADAGELPDRHVPAQQIIRQRRSAVEMDGRTGLPRAVFYHIMSRLLPAARPPFALWPWPPRVSLALFVHRVEGLVPGLYVLVRHARHEPALRAQLRRDFAWDKPPGCPDALGLWLLRAGDFREAARTISCHQDIAADGVFSVAMLAEFEAALRDHGPAFYPRLFWETGHIGQMLYLEAEAAGVRGTGMGCFFDDALHELLGITSRTWQSLYHFTVGGPLDDPRLQTLPAYAHLPEQKGSGYPLR